MLVSDCNVKHVRRVWKSNGLELAAYCTRLTRFHIFFCMIDLTYTIQSLIVYETGPRTICTKWCFIVLQIVRFSFLSYIRAKSQCTVLFPFLSTPSLRTIPCLARLPTTLLSHRSLWGKFTMQVIFWHLSYVSPGVDISCIFCPSLVLNRRFWA